MAYILWAGREGGGGRTKEGLDNSIVLVVACQGGRGLFGCRWGWVVVGDKGHGTTRPWTGLAVDMLRAGAGQNPYSTTYLAVNDMERPEHNQATEELISPRTNQENGHRGMSLPLPDHFPGHHLPKHTQIGKQEPTKAVPE